MYQPNCPNRGRGRGRQASLSGAVAIALFLSAACSSSHDEEHGLRFSSASGGTQEGQTASSDHERGDFFPVAAPPFSDGIFPCSECHEDMDTNLERRELEDEHEGFTLHHGDRERWCFDCHDPDDRDMLRLASGKKIPFTESYRLCGQCHGDKYRDWRRGAHGKRTGKWSGKKEYLLCAHCHNPHSPHFEPLKPLPAPTRPVDTRRRFP